MKINILAFGQMAEVTGKNSWSISDIKTTGEFNRLLLKDFPDLKSINFLIAVNKKIIREDVELHHDDTVALLPPFSGG
ncbi:MAG: MoaD/ThiS family protein [Chitinophagaceae bacterium]|nr:MoaD/ThiS family protein [Chitinophagaceae bacterium]